MPSTLDFIGLKSLLHGASFRLVHRFACGARLGLAMRRDVDDDRLSPLESALAYARRGWLVFPVFEATEDGHCACGRTDCRDPGKHPRTFHGVKEATTDAATIQAWWQRWPQANIGIATGAESGVIVVDVDPRHGGDESLRRLEDQHDRLPRTPRARSGGDGDHIYLRHPGRPQTIRNVQGLGDLQGLDLKGDGGYIIADPSLHASGRRYAWRRWHHPDRVEIALAPQWLLALARPQASGERKETGELEDWRKRLLGVAQGQRHQVAAQITGHYLARGWHPEEVEAMLQGFAAQCSPPHDPEDIRRIVADLAAASSVERPGSADFRTGVCGTARERLQRDARLDRREPCPPPGDRLVRVIAIKQERCTSIHDACAWSGWKRSG